MENNRNPQHLLYISNKTKLKPRNQRDFNPEVPENVSASGLSLSEG